MNSTFFRFARRGFLALLVGLILSGEVSAAVLTVTTALDLVDPADGLPSLREAITAANSDTAAPRIINFAIGSGLQTITLGSALPDVAKFMVIDATTQPGYDVQNPTPLVVIDGNFGDFDGLRVNAFFTGNTGNKTSIKGLCI